MIGIGALTWIVAGALFAVSGIHIYWTFGGRWGANAAVPSTGSGPLFRPSIFATAVVAVLAAIAAWFVIEWGGGYKRLFPQFLFSFGGWVLAAVFIVRAVGDFRWLGFFKRNKGTVFARWDSMLYSPLCLFLGVALVLIGLLR
jgi:hypothetical protein